MVELDAEWAIVEMGITKLINIIEGVVPESPMDVEFWMKLYTTVYTMVMNESLDYYSEQLPSNQLYQRYIGVTNDYLISKALPSIQEKQDDHVSLLQEFVKRWANQKVMVSKFSRFLSVLDRYCIGRTDIRSLKDGGFDCFREIVYEKMKFKVRDAVIALVNRERAGEEIDCGLVRDAVEVFVEIGNGNLDYYVSDFETGFLVDSVDYYERHGGSVGITALECLQLEKDNKVSHYLHSSTEEKLLEQVQGPRLAYEDPEKEQLIRQLLDESLKGPVKVQDPGKANKVLRRKPGRH